jgi:hypothetical protein
VSKPRSHLEEPGLYGRSGGAKWRQIVAGAEPQVSAAYRQHLAALNLRAAGRAAQDRPLHTDELLADLLGYDAETLRRKLRGESWATAEDLSRWALAFKDAEVLPGSGVLLPPPELLAAS